MIDNTSLKNWKLNEDQKSQLSKLFDISEDEESLLFLRIEKTISRLSLPVGNDPIGRSEINKTIQNCEELVAQLNHLPEEFRSYINYRIASTTQVVLTALNKPTNNANSKNIDNDKHQQQIKYTEYFADKETLFMTNANIIAEHQGMESHIPWDNERFSFAKQHKIDPKGDWFYVEKCTLNGTDTTPQKTKERLPPGDPEFDQMTSIHYDIDIASNGIEAIQAIKDELTQLLSIYSSYKKLDYLCEALFHPFLNVQSNQRSIFSYSENGRFVRYLDVILSAIFTDHRDLPAAIKKSLQKATWPTKYLSIKSKKGKKTKK